MVNPYTIGALVGGEALPLCLSVGVHKLEVQFGSRIVSDITPKEVWNLDKKPPARSPQ